MMLKSLSAFAALLMTTSFAGAAFDAQSVAAQLTADGYTIIEIKLGQTIAKVEAIKGTTKIEVTYDLASGEVIKSETESVDDSGSPGVTGEDDDPGEDDGPDHDVNDDHGGDDEVDDDSGDDDDSEDDDSEDDDSEDDDSGGSDDDGDDENEADDENDD